MMAYSRSQLCSLNGLERKRLACDGCMPFNAGDLVMSQSLPVYDSLDEIPEAS